MPTTNPVPSQDPSDLLFNAGKLDEVLNGTGNSFTDRLGTARRTVAGMNADFDAQLADAESDLNVYRSDAAASAAEALGYLQTIRATSYGAYESDPATDPLGNSPTVGDEYFNTTANLLKRWNGTTWQASDINTANLAAHSGSSLVGYNGQTVQDVLDAVTGPTGAASVGYTPAGTGAVATTVRDALRASSTKLTDYLTFVEALAIQTRISTTDFTAHIQKAIDATPSGGTLEINIPGIALIDTLPSVKIESDLGNNWMYGGLVINKPMRLIGNKNFKLKIKDFSSAWVSQELGDAICAVLVTSSFVHIDGFNIDVNADNHYEISGAHKWWEYGPTNKRPPGGIAVSVARDQANVEFVLVENCLIDRPLFGVAFYGNVIDANRASLLNMTVDVGAVAHCKARNNVVTYARGNCVETYMGAMDCVSEGNIFINPMYHTVRYYTRSTFCKALNDTAIIDCQKIIDRYTPALNGYWRTTDTASPQYKMPRSGFRIGAEADYDAFGVSVTNCGFDNCRVYMKQLASGQSTYFELSSVYMSGFSGSAAIGCYVTNNHVEGHVHGIYFYRPLTTPEALFDNNVIAGNTAIKSTNGDITVYQMPGVVVSDNKITPSSEVAGYSMYLFAAKNAIIGQNKFFGTPNSGMYAIAIESSCDGVKLEGNSFGPGFAKNRRYVQVAGSTPKCPFPGRLLSLIDAEVISGGALSNGWSVAYETPSDGQQNQIFVNQDNSIRIQMRLTAAAATTNTVATLISQFSPKETTGFVATDISTGASYWGRVISDGRIQINLPAYPSASLTQIYAEVTFNPV